MDEFASLPVRVVSQKKNSRRILWLIIFAILTISLGAAAWWAWKKQNEKISQIAELSNQLMNLQEENRKLSGEIATIKEEVAKNQAQGLQNLKDEYFGWNYYSNPFLGYELRYPADWKLEEVEEMNETLGSEVKYITISSANDQYVFYWGFKEKSDKFAISNRTGVGAGDLIQEGSVTILGSSVPVKKLIYKGKVKEYFFPGPGTQKTADGKYLFSASLGARAAADYSQLNINNISELEQVKLILLSVRIIPRSAPESACPSDLDATDKSFMKNWKVYKNSSYGYTFYYPAEWKTEKINDKLVNFENNNGLVLSWRSEEMNSLGFEDWEKEKVQYVNVACQEALLSKFREDDKRMLLAQFKKNGKNHSLVYYYLYENASDSQKQEKIFGLILKSVEFK